MNKPLRNDSLTVMSRSRAVRRIFGHFRHHLRPHGRTMAIVVMCTFAMTVMQLLRPWPLKVIFDVILLPQENPGAVLQFVVGLTDDTGVLLAMTALSILAIAVLTGLFGFGQFYLTHSVGQKVVAAIRRQLYSHIQRLSHSFHDASRTGNLLEHLKGDIRLMREVLVGAPIYISHRLLVLVGMVAIMLWMDWQLTIVALGILPLLAFTVRRFSVEIKQASRRLRHKESDVTSTMTEKISAFRIVQAFAREAYEEERFARENESSVQAGLAAARLEGHLSRLVEVTLALGTCGVVWFSVKRVQTGLLTPGDLLVFIAYLRALYNPIRKLASLTSRISRATVSGERIISILETEPEIRDAPDAIQAPRFRGEIVFEDVDFSYNRAEPVLKGVSFRVEPGQMVGLVGESGVGKSTVANLLLRFYDPQAGRILIDGTDTRKYRLSSLREQFAVVLQDAELFNATIRDNIAYGNLEASAEDIKAAAQLANAHEFIEGLEDGYDTIVGERGATLSHGQRQRIAIARAFVRNAPILILDEPLTGLDVENKAKVQKALEHLMVGKTCLVMTHDLEMAARANLILLLNGGHRVEVGRHRDLMAQSARYRELHRLKAGHGRTMTLAGT